MHAKLDCFGLTDVGLKRKENQDQFLIAELNQTMRLHQSSLTINDQEFIHGRSQGQVLIVADGMGGHAGGKRASQIAVETMVHCLLEMMPLNAEQQDSAATKNTNEQRLTQALHQCQLSIEREGQSVPEKAEMGTTFTMSYLIWPTCYLLHVGDSRAYLLRNKKLSRLTEDQTLAEKHSSKERLNRNEEAETNALSHMLWGYLGVDSQSLKPELQRIELELNDTLMLCSDGLNKHLSDDEIGQLLEPDVPAEVTCQNLISAALDAGGSDNVTVVVAKIRDSEAVLDAQVAEAEEPVKLNEDTQEFFEIPVTDTNEELT